MAINLSVLSNAQTAAAALSNLILVNPQKTVGYQPQPSVASDSSSVPDPAFIFHYEGENTVSLESDITDHFVEDNTAIQDQIALRPELVSVHGFIGELSDVAPPLLQPLLTAANKLTIISAYTPALSATAIIAYNVAFQAYQTASLAISSSVAAWASITNTGGESVVSSGGIQLFPYQTKQQVAFQKFYGYWRNRTLFTIQTPWAIFENMAIKSVRAIQNEDNDDITDFELTFKMIRFASSQVTVLTGDGRFNNQGASTTNIGSQTPQPSLGLDTALSNQFGGLL